MSLFQNAQDAFKEALFGVQSKPGTLSYEHEKRVLLLRNAFFSDKPTEALADALTLVIELQPPLADASPRTTLIKMLMVLISVTLSEHSYRKDQEFNQVADTLTKMCKYSVEIGKFCRRSERRGFLDQRDYHYCQHITYLRGACNRNKERHKQIELSETE